MKIFYNKTSHIILLYENNFIPLCYLTHQSMQFTTTYTDKGAPAEITFEAEFVAIYEEWVYVGDEVEISAIQINGTPVQSFGTSADWRKFLEVLRQAARDQVSAQRVRIELGDVVAGMEVKVVDWIRVAA